MLLAIMASNENEIASRIEFGSSKNRGTLWSASIDCVIINLVYGYFSLYGGK